MLKGKQKTTLLASLSIKGLIMDNQKIIELYDSNINMTLSELSKITGLTVKQLKNILLGVK